MTPTPRRGIRPAATAALLALAVVLTACGSKEPSAEREDQASPTATDGAGGPVDSAVPSDDAGRLHNVFEFPGQPEVLWTEEPLGAPQNDRAPGPTDYAYDAVLDYGDPATVTDLVTGLTPEPSLLADVPAWYPAAVADAAEGAGVVVNVYTGVPGFSPHQEVGVVENQPRYVLLSRSTT